MASLETRSPLASRDCKHSLARLCLMWKFENKNTPELSLSLSESGKVAVEYRPGEESIDAEGEEDLQSLIQVRGDRALGVPSGVVRTHTASRTALGSILKEVQTGSALK